MNKKGFTVAVLVLAMGAASTVNADFVVVSQYAAPDSEISKRGDLVAGFGNSVMFGDLIQEIIPGDWVVSCDPRLLEQEVSWTGGVTWLQLLESISNKHGWHMNMNKEVKTISISDGISSVKEIADSVELDLLSTPMIESGNEFSGVTGSLTDRVSVNLRNKTLQSVLNILAPQGWKVDTQFSEALLETVIDYTAEKTRGDALAEVLAPIGLTVLSYPNMSPSPLLVIVKGER